jgi:hypothetical protein
MAEAVDACAAVSLWPLDAAGRIQTLDAVVAAQRQLLGLKLCYFIPGRATRRMRRAGPGPARSARTRRDEIRVNMSG